MVLHKKINQTLYLSKDEQTPVRTTQNKRFMQKVMFLVAVAQPRMYRGKYFNGKLGCFPLIEKVRAKRSSRKRQKGKMEIQAITSVTAEVVTRTIIDKLLPNIVALFPRDTGTITIQLDGAGAHSIHNNDLIKRAFIDSGLDIRLMKQPAQSPDLNVLDLGYFTSIQGLQQKMECNTVDDLVENVLKSYEELEIRKLENIWITLQLVMLEIIKINGGNTYVLPHVNKSVLEMEGSIRTEVVIKEELRDMIDIKMNLVNQKLITTYYPTSTCPHSKCSAQPTVPSLTRSRTKCLLLINS